MDQGPLSAGGPGPPDLHPLGVGETLDASVYLYRDHATTLWGIVAAVIVPLGVLEMIVRRAALPSGVFVYKGSLYTHGAAGNISTSATVAVLLVEFVALLGELLATGAVFKLVLDAYLGHAPDWRESFAYTRERLAALAWLGIIIAVLLLVGFVLLVVPGVWLLVASSVAVPALMVERQTGFRALRRSMELVDTRWWATFMRLLPAFVLYFVVSLAAGSIIDALTNALHVSNVFLWVAFDAAVRAIVTILMTPFIAAVITVIYVDLRLRKEGRVVDLIGAEPGPFASGAFQ